MESILNNTSVDINLAPVKYTVSQIKERQSHKLMQSLQIYQNYFLNLELKAYVNLSFNLSYT